MPACTALGWKSSANLSSPAGASLSPPQPLRAAPSTSRRGIRRTASNPTAKRSGHRQQEVQVQDRGLAAYIAEFIGTLLLVFFITAAVSIYVGEPTRTLPNPFIDFSVIGLVHVFVLFVLIQTLGIVSGAHFNPAVTAAMTALRQIKPPDAAIYVVAQLAGAVAGALLTKGLLLNEGKAVNYGATTVSDRILEGSILPGMVAEAI